MKKYLITLIIALTAITNLHASTQIGSYGFEDWDGSIHTTPNYPFSTSFEEFWCVVEDCNPPKYAGNPTYYDGYAGINHDVTTQPITSYASNTGGTWTAHTGTYYLMGNDSDVYMPSPSIPGITSGTVNQQGRNLGEGISEGYGGLDKANWDFSQITTGEVFISFWARRNVGYGTFTAGTYNKWVVVSTNDVGLFFHIEADEVPSNFRIRQNDITLGTTPTVSDCNDGGWHKYSIYINFNTDTIKWWYDADDESVDTPLIDYTGGIDGTAIEGMHIQGNFSAQNPTESTYHALDDIEIWDGMPTASGDESSVIGPGTSSTFSSGTSTVIN